MHWRRIVLTLIADDINWVVIHNIFHVFSRCCWCLMCWWRRRALGLFVCNMNKATLMKIDFQNTSWIIKEYWTWKYLQWRFQERQIDHLTQDYRFRLGRHYHFVNQGLTLEDGFLVQGLGFDSQLLDLLMVMLQRAPRFRSLCCLVNCLKMPAYSVVRCYPEDNWFACLGCS